MGQKEVVMNTESNKPLENQPATPAATPAPAEAGSNLAPVTKGNVPGGWNRFAGYKPGEAKNKKNDRRDRDSRGRR